MFRLMGFLLWSLAKIVIQFRMRTSNIADTRGMKMEFHTNHEE
jgi:hypothetical protein